MQKGVDYTGVAITYCCHDGKGNMLFAKRSKNCRDEQERWDLGGGALEFGETIEDTLKKEIKEEYCTDVLDYEFLGYRDAHRKHNGIKTHWVAIDFKVLVDPKKVKNGEPHKFDAFGWFTFENLPSPLHSLLPDYFKLYKDKINL